jgi:hypothetical protein
MTNHQYKVRYQATLIVTTSLVLALLCGWMKHQMQIQASWADPRPIERDVVVIEKEVEKVVEVPRLPKTVEEEIRGVFGKDAPTALRVAKCESGYNPKAKNGTSSARGVFQVMQSWHQINEKWLYNPGINIRVAYQLFQEQGWGPWEASRHCWGK